MRRISPIGRIAENSGFTLLEVLVAMAIVSLATLGLSLAWPHWIETGESRRAMLELTSFIAAARDEAVSTGRIITLTYDASSRHFVADGESHTLPRSAQAIMTGTSGNPRISFFPDGSSSGGRLEISVGQQRAMLHIDRLTGALHE